MATSAVEIHDGMDVLSVMSADSYKYIYIFFLVLYFISLSASVGSRPVLLSKAAGSPLFLL